MIDVKIHQEPSMLQQHTNIEENEFNRDKCEAPAHERLKLTMSLENGEMRHKNSSCENN